MKNKEENNITRLNEFIAQTLDYLADPVNTQRKLPVDVLEISEIISSKMKDENREEFFML